MGPVGRVKSPALDPTKFLRSFNFSHLPEAERSRFYRETRRPDGSLLREYELIAVDREIEIAPGVFFPAWTFNGGVPGPTIRATEGDRVRVNFIRFHRVAALCTNSTPNLLACTSITAMPSR
jgi:hypothetical protein